MLPYTVTTTIIGITIGLTIIFLIRHDRLRSFYAFWWILVAIGVIFLGFFPKTVDKLGSFFGVYYPPILVLVLAIAFLLIKILTMDLERTEQEQKIRILAQKVSLLETELESLRDSKVKNSYQDRDDNST